ncbi:unnamed protein product [Alopecurus aequalis]
MPCSSSIEPDHGVASATDLDASAAVVRSRPWTGRGGPEDFASFLRTQEKVDAICKEHGVPKEFTALPAGDLRANSTPPRGAICVCLRALEAGMRVPLPGFFCEALAYFGIAPAQLTPNGWRTMAGFLALCRSVGVPPSLAVFQHFFKLSSIIQRDRKGWYFFPSRHSSGLRFTGMPHPNWSSFKYWKNEFFFLSSPEPWPCPVEWGEPPKSCFKNPVLNGEENESAAKLLRAYGDAPVDLRKYLSNSSLGAALITTALPPTPSSSTCIISSPQGLDPSVYDMMKTMLAQKAAASLKKVKGEPSSDAPGSPPSNGKKRSLQEANCEEKPAREPSDAVASSCAVILQGANNTSFSLSYALELEEKLLNQERDAAALREQLEEAKTEVASAKRRAEQEKAKAELAAAGAELAKAKGGLAAAEAEVMKAKAELTAAKRAADVAEQGKGRPELATQGAEVANAMAKLAAAKRALEEELDSAKVVAVHQLLCCEEHVLRRAERALQGYRRWRIGRAA